MPRELTPIGERIRELSPEHKQLLDRMLIRIAMNDKLTPIMAEQAVRQWANVVIALDDAAKKAEA